jgi:hypothetical protein
MVKASVLAESISYTRVAGQTLSGASSCRSDETNHGQHIFDAMRAFDRLELVATPGYSSAARSPVQPPSHREGKTR